MRSLRSTVRIWLARSAEASACACSSASACSRAASTCIARALFCSCERSFWQVTTMPVGRWVMRTAESVVLTPWPPLPDDR